MKHIRSTIIVILLQLVCLLGEMGTVHAGDVRPAGGHGKSYEPLGVAGVAADDVWFSPNVASQDMLLLFSDPNQWASARSRVKVFKFYDLQVTDNCGNCDQNVLTNFQKVDAFHQLAIWSKGIAVETGSLKSWSCDCVKAGDRILESIANIKSSGGTVRYVSMDEPWMSNVLFCHLPQAQAAQNVKNYIGRVKQAYPSVLIGTEEAYLQNDKSGQRNMLGILKWFDALRKVGVQLAFIHLDVDRNAVSSWSTVYSDMRNLRSYCNNHGIVLGVLFAGAGSTNKAYYDSVIDIINRTKAAIGVPQHSVFMSWAGATADGSLGNAMLIPDNLPECDSHTHTRLINDGLCSLYNGGDNASYVGQSVPTTMKAGQKYTVWIAMKNTGGTTWGTIFYNLHELGPYNTWGICSMGICEISIDPYVGCAGPNLSYTFTFQVTAPSTPGTYAFQWQMGTDWWGTTLFGQPTPVVSVTVVP